MPVGASTPVGRFYDTNLSQWRDMLLSSGAELMDCLPGAVLSRSGEDCRYVYFLVRGLVKVYTENATGAVRLLGYHMADSMFALDCLRGKGSSIITTEAITSLTILRFTPALLESICRQNADFATDLAMYVSDVLRLMCVDAESQTICDVKERLAHFLSLYLQSSVLPVNSLCIPMSQDSLAAAINASRVHTARVCAQLKEEGIISVGRKRLTILDLEKLYALCK